MMEETLKQHTNTRRTGGFQGLSSFGLHILAMALMLCDHLWATLIPGNAWLTWIGRLAYPIFAFMIAEGYHHTKDLKQYMRRLLIFAVLSEIPFNLVYSDVLIWPFQQNVMWTFLLALWFIRRIDLVREKHKPLSAALISICLVVVGYWAAQLTMVDYKGAGFLTVLLFHYLRGGKWWQRLGQLAGLIYINTSLISGLTVPVTLFGVSFELPQQSMAVLALIPIWLYNGKRGFHNKWVQYAFYAFYPVHMLVLGLLH